mmetsp:Transcript_19676/g.48368  ORF Transcript_19676/g.48368 Transcript_19676/m.48368 type:complete len:303 (-) Transcript_19676:237-1145(-)
MILVNNHAHVNDAEKHGKDANGQNHEWSRNQSIKDGKEEKETHAAHISNLFPPFTSHTRNGSLVSDGLSHFAFDLTLEFGIGVDSLKNLVSETVLAHVLASLLDNQGQENHEEGKIDKHIHHLSFLAFLQLVFQVANAFQFLEGTTALWRHMGLGMHVHQAGILVGSKGKTKVRMQSVGIHFSQTTANVVVGSPFFRRSHQMFSIQVELFGQLRNFFWLGLSSQLRSSGICYKVQIMNSGSLGRFVDHLGTVNGDGTKVVSITKVLSRGWRHGKEGLNHAIHSLSNIHELAVRRKGPIHIWH